MNAKEIKELCALGENSKVQFKLKIDNPSKIAAEIVAFANYRGGTILIGVEDKTGEIVGLTDDEVQQIRQSRCRKCGQQQCKANGLSSNRNC